MIQNMKRGTNNIEVILCAISKCGLLPPFCLVAPVYHNLDHTTFCTILECFDGKGCDHGVCLTGMLTS